MRTKNGKLGWTPRVFGSCRANSNIRNAAIARDVLTTKKAGASAPHPKSVKITPATFTTSAPKSSRERIGLRPRNTVPFSAESPDEWHQESPCDQHQIALVENV